MSNPDIFEQMRQLLCELQLRLRDDLITARGQYNSVEMSVVAEHTAADTIYQIDKVSEATIAKWFEDHWPREWPLQIIMEGVDDATPLTFPHGTPVADTKWICIIDPIDGTRPLMYDKRSAWALAGIAPQKGHATTLADIQVAAMTELPTSKHWRSDQLSAIRGRGCVGVTHDLVHKTTAPMIPTPAQATDCRHGFSYITRFFADGLVLLSRIEEILWYELYPETRNGSPVVFNDQYMTTGGQLFEIAVGHDRFIADIRPLALKKLGMESSLACHPYDLAAMLVVEEAGVIVEDPVTGGPITAPLDTVTSVSWCAYANPTLAAHIRPVLRAAIESVLG